MRIDELTQRIEGLLQPILGQREAFCVDVRVISQRSGKLVQAFVDTESGITIGECAEISRELSVAIDRDGLIGGSYRLEVSSPGIGQPLRLLRQYRKNIGRKFRLKFGRSGETVVTRAILRAVEGDQLAFSQENEDPLVLSHSDIIEAREELPW